MGPFWYVKDPFVVSMCIYLNKAKLLLERTLAMLWGQAVEVVLPPTEEPYRAFVSGCQQPSSVVLRFLSFAASYFRRVIVSVMRIYTSSWQI